MVFPQAHNPALWFAFRLRPLALTRVWMQAGQYTPMVELFAWLQLPQMPAASFFLRLRARASRHASHSENWPVWILQQVKHMQCPGLSITCALIRARRSRCLRAAASLAVSIRLKLALDDNRVKSTKVTHGNRPLNSNVLYCPRSEGTVLRRKVTAATGMSFELEAARLKPYRWTDLRASTPDISMQSSTTKPSLS